MHQLIGNSLVIAVVAEKCLKEFPHRHRVYPQIVPASCAAQLYGGFYAELSFDNAGNFFSLFLLIQSEDDFDPRWDVCAGTMSYTAITKPASKQVTQVAIEFQAILKLVVCSPI